MSHPHDPHSSGSICISLVHEALAAAQQHGLDVQAILDTAQISSELYAAPKGRVSVDQYAKLWISLADQLNDEFFGMDRRPLRRGSYQLLSKWVRHAQTLEQALTEACRFLNLCFDDLSSELQLSHDQAYLLIHDHAQPKSMFCYATYWMLLHGLMCWLSGQRVVLDAMHVKASRPSAHRDYQVRFCEDIYYEQTRNVIAFSRAYLNIKIKQDDASWLQFLSATPHNLLVRFKNPHAFSRQIRQHLNTVAPCDWLELPELAQQLNMSEATIQRRLKREGLSYQQLKNEIRRDTAIALLTQTSCTLQQISEQLNFHDPSAFHRAFKKWTGLSPGAYRLQQ